MEEKHLVQDDIINVSKAALNLIPVVGGILSSLVGDYIPTQKQKRREILIHEMQDDLRRIEGRIDQSYISSEKLKETFESCWNAMEQTEKTEKLRMIKAVFINSFLPSFPQDDEIDYFLGLIDRLSVLHLKILSFLNNPSSYLEYIGMEATQINKDFEGIFRTVFPSVPIEIISLSIQDLHNWGLIRFDQTLLKTMTSSRGLALVGHRTTEAADRFIEYTTLQG